MLDGLPVEAGLKVTVSVSLFPVSSVSVVSLFVTTCTQGGSDCKAVRRDLLTVWNKG